jgi:hypothetical protein
MRSHTPRSQEALTSDSRLAARVRDEIHGRRLALLATAIDDHARSSSRVGLGVRAHDGSLYRRLRDLGPVTEVAS